MVNWSENTKHTLPFNCSNTTQDKTKAPKAPIDESYGVQTSSHKRRVRCIGAQASINDG